MKKLIHLALVLLIISCSEESVLPEDQLQQEISGTENPYSKVDATQYSVAADFRGRIKRIRIRERKDGQYRIVEVDTEGASPKDVGYVSVKFEEPFEGPIPSNTVIKASKPRNSGRGGKRYSWLEWDNSEMIGKSSIGFTYAVTATMHNKKGDVIGPSFSQKVLIEEYISINEMPKIIDFSVFSKDKGRTWNATLEIKDQGDWVEKVEVQFADYKQKISFENVRGKDIGNKKAYATEGMRLHGLKPGQEISVVVFMNGKGTRKTSSQTSTILELL